MSGSVSGNYRRVVFTSYWEDNPSPATELFYLVPTAEEIPSISGLDRLQSVVLSILRERNNNRCKRVIYVSNELVSFTEFDLQFIESRVIPGLDLSGTRE